jgi:hypothetical protein
MQYQGFFITKDVRDGVTAFEVKKDPMSRTVLHKTDAMNKAVDWIDRVISGEIDPSAEIKRRPYTKPSRFTADHFRLLKRIDGRLNMLEAQMGSLKEMVQATHPEEILDWLLRNGKPSSPGLTFTSIEEA